MTQAANELDTVFGILADRNRRIVLAELIDNSENVVSLGDLVERIQAEQATQDGEPVLVEESVRVMLVHNHLPKLEEAGVIEFDKRSETVRYYPNEFIENIRRFVNGEADYPIT